MAKAELKKKSVAAPVKLTTAEEKKKALASAIAHIEKMYGAGAVMKLGQTKALNVDAIPTGSMTLDLALGIGGVPRGRIVELYGPESSGKTTVALHIIAEAQKLGGEVASSTWSTPWIRCMRKSWGSTSTTCWYPSRTAASRHWRSQRHWYAPVPLT